MEYSNPCLFLFLFPTFLTLYIIHSLKTHNRMKCCNRCSKALEDDGTKNTNQTTPALGDSYVLLSNSISRSSIVVKSSNSYHSRNMDASMIRSLNPDSIHSSQLEKKKMDQLVDSCISMDLTSLHEDFASSNSMYVRPSLLDQPRACDYSPKKNATLQRELQDTKHAHADMSHHVCVMTSRHALW